MPSFVETPTSVIWDGISSLFAEAFNSIKAQVFPRNQPPALIYMMDGQALTLPVATRLDHTEPHWVPTVLHIRTPAHDAMVAEAKAQAGATREAQGS